MTRQNLPIPPQRIGLLSDQHRHISWRLGKRMSMRRVSQAAPAILSGKKEVLLLRHLFNPNVEHLLESTRSQVRKRRLLSELFKSIGLHVLRETGLELQALA